MQISATYAQHTVLRHVDISTTEENTVLIQPTGKVVAKHLQGDDIRLTVCICMEIIKMTCVKWYKIISIKIFL